MSRRYNGSSDYLYSTGFGLKVTAAPYTLCFWAKASNANYVVCLGNSSFTGNVLTYVQFGANVAGKVNADFNFGAATLNANNPYRAADWNHVAVVVRSSTDRSLVVNGTDIVNNTASVTQTGMNAISFGALFNLGTYFNGRLADVCLWDVGLTLAEIARMGRNRVSGLSVRRGSLKHAWMQRDGRSPEYDLVSRAHLAIGSGTQVIDDNPRTIELPARRVWRNSPIAVAAATGIPYFYRHIAQGVGGAA